MRKNGEEEGRRHHGEGYDNPSRPLWVHLRRLVEVAVQGAMGWAEIQVDKAFADAYGDTLDE
jgi:hypothetical protein